MVTSNAILLRSDPHDTYVMNHVLINIEKNNTHGYHALIYTKIEHLGINVHESVRYRETHLTPGKNTP